MLAESGLFITVCLLCMFSYFLNNMVTTQVIYIKEKEEERVNSTTNRINRCSKSVVYKVKKYLYTPGFRNTRFEVSRPIPVLSDCQSCC